MENWRSMPEEEEEERGAASGLVGPARRSLRRWARPAPYTPSPRRFVSNFLSKPSPPIRTLLDTPRVSQPRANENAGALAFERNQVSLTQEILEEKELVTVDDSEVAEIEKYLKERTFSRDEADHLIEANALGCTPIDIAKAYMRDLSSSKAGSSYQTRTSRDAENSSEKHDSSAKLRIGWPGSNLPVNNGGCRTPQSSRGNTVQDATPSRTSFADSPFSRSTFKIKNDRDRCDVFSTGRKRRLNTLDEGKNQKAKLEDDTSSKFADPEDDTSYSINRSHVTSQSSLGKSKDEVGFSGASSLWAHNRRSTQTAQKILSQLERAIPSPSEKSPLQRQINKELPSSSLLINNRKQESFQVSGSSDQKMPDVRKDDGVSKSSALTTKQNPDMGGFGFTFPVPAVNTASSEPPPTPTMPSPRHLPVSVNLPEAPTYRFGSSSSSRLVFSFASSDNASTILDEEPPTFKFGSEQRRLSFSFSEKEAICC